jgi:hemerythrin-like domain-containing protein
MKATEELKTEHVHILKMLTVLEAICARLESGVAAPHEHLDLSLDFIRGFADRCHHAKEEEALFPAMERAGIPREGGPLGVMLHEHSMAREFTREFEEGISLYKRNDGSGAARILKYARAYADLLNQHIYREDNVLYVMADRRFSSEEQERLCGEFDRIERDRIGKGMHEKFHETLHLLMNAYGVGR